MRRQSVADWIGAALRLSAFAVLFMALLFVATAAWRTLPESFTRLEILGSAVVVSAAATIAGVALIRGVDGRSATALGLGVSSATARHCALGMLTGAAALAAATLALVATGKLSYYAEGGSVSGWLVVLAAHLGIFAIAAFAEEVLFRGYAFQVLARALGTFAAAVVTAALFALAHANNPSVGWIALVNIFLAGLLLAAAYVRTLSLWFATAVHLGWNWTMASLFDLPVSGLAGFETPMYEARIGEPAWWSGGAFGPEGGVAGSLGFVVALLLVLRWRAIGSDPAIAAAGPLFLDRHEERNAG